MPIRLSTAAETDLFKVAIDGLEQFGPAQVAKYEAGLQKTLMNLAQNPNLAREHKEYWPPVRIFPYKAHVIVFQLEDKGIFIVRICNAREDWTRFDEV